MAKIMKWRSYHVRIETLEQIMGVRLVTFRNMYKPHVDVELEPISIRVHCDRWDYYGIREALESLGLENQRAVYINL